MKKLVISISMMCLFLSTCLVRAEVTSSSVNVVFAITNSNKKASMKYVLVDPRGETHKGVLWANAAFTSDTAVITFNNPDESLYGVYMLHYKSLDSFWGQTLYANDAVVVVEKNAKVLCAVSNEGMDMKITISDLTDQKVSEQHVTEPETN